MSAQPKPFDIRWEPAVEVLDTDGVAPTCRGKLICYDDLQIPNPDEGGVAADVAAALEAREAKARVEAEAEIAKADAEIARAEAEIARARRARVEARRARVEARNRLKTAAEVLDTDGVAPAETYAISLLSDLWCNLLQAPNLYEGAATSAALKASYAPETRRTYASVWKNWLEWQRMHGHYQFVTSPQNIADFLAARIVGGHSIATAKHARAAIRFAFLEVGLPDPTDNEDVRHALRGPSRQAGGRSKQAAALTRDVLAAIVATATRPRSYRNGVESTATALRRGQKDIALISTMRDGLLRRSEAAALCWADIDFMQDGTGRLTIRRSKTDQEGAVTVQFLSKQTVSALRKIQPGDNTAPPSDPETSVFGLSAVRIGQRIAAAALAAGVPGDFSGHSPRVGMACDLAASGCELPALMQAGRWARAARYTCRETAGRGAVAQYYGEA